MHLCAVFLLVLFLAPVLAAQDSDSDSENRIVRLSPSAFDELPAVSIRIMEQRGCTVPQYGTQGEPGNVIVGDLDGDGREGDFAWLCSRADSAQLLAYTTYGGLEKLTERKPDDTFWTGYFNLELLILGIEEAERYNERKRREWGMDIPVASHATLILGGEKDSLYLYYLRGLRWLKWNSIH